MTEVFDDPDSELAALVARVADDFRARRARGENPDINNYASEHPQAAAQIRDVLGILQLVDPTPARRIITLENTVTGTLGDFRVGREVGRGGMGVVYEATQISLGRRVALKVLPFAALVDARMLQRFQNEARAAAALDHPHIVKVHAVGQERGVHFIAMQFIEGRPLSDTIRELHGSASPNLSSRTAIITASLNAASATSVVDAVVSTFPDTLSTRFFHWVAELGVKAADALEHAHSLGVVHRDVKPANLLIDAQGSPWISDFGLAKITSTDAGVTMTGDVFGTLRYMSPEQALAKHGLVDHRTDVYALGATLYELLVGRPVIGGTDKAEILRKIIDEEPVAPRRVNRAIPIDLETIVLKCLRKEPNDRYASAKELADDLRRFVAGTPVVARPVGNLERSRRWVARRAIPISLSALTCLALLVAITLGVRDSYREEASRIASEAAADREERDRVALRASQDAAEQLRFFALFERVRQRRADPKPGWSGESMAELRELAAMPLAREFRPDLRSEVAAALSALDLVPAGTLGTEFPGGAVDYSPDGRWLAAARWGELLVRLFDPVTGAGLHDLSIPADKDSLGWTARSDMSDRVQSVKFSPDNRWLVAGTTSGRLACWDTQNFGAGPRVWAAHTEPQDWLYNMVFSIVFRPDSRTFHSSARASIREWSVTGQPIGPLIAGYRMAFASHPFTGGIPVSDQQEEFHHLLDPETRELVPGTKVLGRIPMAVSSGGRLMAYMPRPGTGPPFLQMTDPWAKPHALSSATGLPLQMPVVEHLTFDPVGGLLVSVEEHVNPVKLWDVAAGRLVAEQKTTGDPVRAAFSPDGRRVAVGGRYAVNLFDIPNRVLDTIAPVAEFSAFSVAASPDHANVLVTGYEPDVPVRLYHWQAVAGRRYQVLVDRVVHDGGGPSDVSDYSRDGRLAAYVVGTSLRTTDGRVSTCRKLEAARFGPTGSLWFIHSEAVHEIGTQHQPDRLVWQNDPDWAPSGKQLRVLDAGTTWLFVGRRDGSVVRIDPATGAATTWKVLTTPVDGLALSPDESRLLVAGEGGEIRLVDTATGDAVEIPNAHRASVPGVAFGRHFFVTGSADRWVRLWTLDGKPIASLRMSGPVKKVLLSADESSLLVHVEGERAIRRWKLDVLFKEWIELGLADGLPER